MGLNGDYRSMAEACGETEPQPLIFYPGENFDPYDEDDVENVKLAMANDPYDRDRVAVRRLKDENARLRARLTELGEEVDNDDPAYENAYLG